MFASCSTVSAAAAAAEQNAKDYADALLAGGVAPSGAAGGDLQGTYPNPTLKTASVVDAVEAGIAADTGAQAAIAAAIADDIVATGAFQTALAAAAPNLKTCAGAAMAAGANVPTCTEMNTAISAAVGAGAAPTGTAGGALTGTYPNPGLSAAAVVAAYALQNCAGVAHAAGASVPSCAEMTAAIEDAVDAIPGDKFLQGLQSYNAATNTMVLAMSDGSTVSIDMTALLNDAVASVTATPDATETVKGIVELATPAEAVAGTSTTLAVTPAGVAAAIAASAPTAQENADAIAADAGAQTTLAASLADNLGATAAETIAGTEAVKFISPDDMSAALQNAADYQIDIKRTVTTAGNAIKGWITDNSTAVNANGAIAGVHEGTGALSGVYGVTIGGTDSSGVYGATATASTYAVRGTSSNLSAFSGYFEGRHHVDGGIYGTTDVLGAASHIKNNGGAGDWIVGQLIEVVGSGTVSAQGSRISVTGLATNNIDIGQQISLSGVTGAGKLSYGASANNNTTGAGEHRGGNFSATGTGGGSNYGVYGTAAGGAVNWAGYFSGNVNVTGTVTQGSDSRIKRDVKTIDTAKALAFRNGLRWVTFEKFITVQDSEGSDVELVTGYEAGLIAQEVQALTQQIGAFEFVVKTSNPEMLALDYMSINAIVMAAEQAALVK